jgi:CubicO group peptidase (beta-lactamase class C family)
MISPPTLQAHVLAEVRQKMTDSHMPSIGVSITHKGAVVLAEGYGLWNVEEEIPATKDSLYSLASLTKGVTATAIMLLVEEDKIILDCPISAYLEKTPDQWAEITVRHLLTHTSGIPCYLNDFPNSDTHRDITTVYMVQRIQNLPLKFQPGSQFSYSNSAYVLLGMIISAASGHSWTDFFAERLFQPLQMSSTRTILDMHSAIKAKVTGYIWENNQHQRCKRWSPSWADAAGGVVSTPWDMAKWATAFYTDHLLKSSSRVQMWSPALLSTGQMLNVGFGWNVNEDDQGWRRHTGYGGGPGISSHICSYADLEVTIVVFCNMSDVFHALGDLARRISRVILPHCMG